MKFADFSLDAQGLRCPELILQLTPGLPEGHLEMFGEVPRVCDTNVTMLLDIHRLQRWVLVPLPLKFPSDGAWWIDMDRISLITAHIILTTFQAESWNGILQVGVITEGQMTFRDKQGLWEASSDAVELPSGALQAWHRYAPRKTNCPRGLKRRWLVLTIFSFRYSTESTLSHYFESERRNQDVSIPINTKCREEHSKCARTLRSKG